MAHGHVREDSSVTVDADGVMRSVIIQDLTGIRIPQGVVIGPDVEFAGPPIGLVHRPVVVTTLPPMIDIGTPPTLPPVVIVDCPRPGPGVPTVMTPEPGTMFLNAAVLLAVGVKKWLL